MGTQPLLASPGWLVGGLQAGLGQADNWPGLQTEGKVCAHAFSCFLTLS